MFLSVKLRIGASFGRKQLYQYQAGEEHRDGGDQTYIDVLGQKLVGDFVFVNDVVVESRSCGGRAEEESHETAVWLVEMTSGKHVSAQALPVASHKFNVRSNSYC